jgi:hypothetical protein
MCNHSPHRFLKKLAGQCKIDTLLIIILKTNLTRKEVGVDMTIQFREEFYIYGTRFSAAKSLMVQKKSSWILTFKADGTFHDTFLLKGQMSMPAYGYQ